MKILCSTIALSAMLISCGGAKNKSSTNDVTALTGEAKELQSIAQQLYGTSWEGPLDEKGNVPDEKTEINFDSSKNSFVITGKSGGGIFFCAQNRVGGEFKISKNTENGEFNLDPLVGECSSGTINGYNKSGPMAIVKLEKDTLTLKRKILTQFRMVNGSIPEDNFRIENYKKK